MSKQIEFTGRKVGSPSQAEAEILNAAKARAEAKHLAAVHSWRTLERFDLKPAGRRGEYLADSSGALWVTVQFESSGIALPGKSASDVDAWYESAAGLPVFLRRPPRDEPQSLGEVEEAREDARRRRREAEAAKLAELEARPLKPYTVSDVERRTLPTLSQAAGRIERAHGVIEADGDRVVVSFHHRPQGVADAIRVLRAEEQIVLAALAESQGEPLSELLPDVQARA